jgi:8-oxo-dGTP diphosphatase
MPETVAGRTIYGEPVTMTVDQLVWRPSAYALIFNAAGELLVLDNNRTHKFDLPGGGIEIWENIPTALIREVWEETGLEVRLTGLRHLHDSFFMTPSGKHWHVIKSFFGAEILGGNLRNSILEDEWSVNPHWVDPQKHREDRFWTDWESIQGILAHGQTAP